MAILAAAYGKQADVVEAVKNAKLDLGMLGARNLYLAKIGETPATEDLERGLGARGNFVTAPTLELADVQLVRPDAVTTIEAIGVLADPAHLPLAIKAAEHPDIRVQVEAARALRLIGDPSAAGPLTKLAAVGSWPVCIEACEGLAAFPRQALHRQTHPAPRHPNAAGCARTSFYALGCIAGEYHGGTATDWANWFKASGADFEVDPAASKTFRETHRPQESPIPANAYFYGIRHPQRPLLLRR